MGKVKEAALQQETPAQLPAKTKTLAVVPATSSNAYLEDGGDSIGEMLRFVKGKWRIGDEIIPLGTRYIAYVPQSLKGWVRFENGKPTDRRVGKVAERFQMPEREELGDL